MHGEGLDPPSLLEVARVHVFSNPIFEVRPNIGPHCFLLRPVMPRYDTRAIAGLRKRKFRALNEIRESAASRAQKNVPPSAYW